MEVKQEVIEYTCKEEIDNEEADALFDTFKIEINEEPQRESTKDAFDFVLKEDLIKIEKYEDTLLEKRETNENSYLQNENKMEIVETPTTEHSSYERNYVSSQVEEKTLNQNMKVEIGQSSYKCEICFKQFGNASNLKRHLRVHTGEKPYKCEICFKQYSGAGSLKIHLRVHTGEKPYKCEICFKQFSVTNSLKIHLRVHTGEKPYKCKICFKHFRETAQLKSHLRVHTGENLHKCEICFKQFLRIDHLKRHLRFTHWGKTLKV